MFYLSPSILAADFKNLERDIKLADEAGADYIHIDVMDGAFVPSISFGMPVIQSIRPVTSKVFDVHLMVEAPERYIDAFAECGADMLTIHVEACTHLERTIQQIRQKGMKVGVALNPATPLNCLEYILNQIDMVLIMTVNPGFGGQKYIENSTEKIAALKKMIQEKQLNVDIQVDGGISTDNLDRVIEAGANVFVVGSNVFNGNITENVKAVRNVFKKYE